LGQNELQTGLSPRGKVKIFEIWSKKLSEAPAVCLRYAWHILRHAAFDVVNGALYLFASVATRH
jgi:hypothetical protein